MTAQGSLRSSNGEKYVRQKNNGTNKIVYCDDVKAVNFTKEQYILKMYCIRFDSNDQPVKFEFAIDNTPHINRCLQVYFGKSYDEILKDSLKGKRYGRLFIVGRLDKKTTFVPLLPDRKCKLVNCILRSYYSRLEGV